MLLVYLSTATPVKKTHKERWRRYQQEGLFNIFSIDFPPSECYTLPTRKPKPHRTVAPCCQTPS